VCCGWSRYKVLVFSKLLYAKEVVCGPGIKFWYFQSCYKEMYINKEEEMYIHKEKEMYIHKEKEMYINKEEEMYIHKEKEMYISLWG
jgi:hypothetical protein